LSSPPNVYLVSPWSPLLPTDSPDYYPSYFTWIPTPLISTQHYTVRPLSGLRADGQLPGLMKAGQQAATLWNSGQKVWTTARSWMKGWGASSAAIEGDVDEAGASGEKMMDKEPVGLPVDAPPPPLPENGEGHQHEIQEDDNEEGEGEGEPQERKSLWGPCECCISCVSAHSRQAQVGLQADERVSDRVFQP
jgi:hypothetical protein